MSRLFTPEWVFPKPVDIPDTLRQEIGGSEAFLEILVRRGLTDLQKAKAFLDPDIYVSCPGSEFPGMEKVLPRVLKAIKNHEKIGIWGDFDVDGQTSTAILVDGFRRLNCDVSYHIPVRGKESHGILVPNLQTFLESGVSLLISCDTGISANDAVDYASQQGVDVIITDHHTLPEKLPDAFVLIDPQFLPEDHPLATLSGSGVAYKFMEALFSEFGRAGEVDSLQDLAALGLIADLAILTGEARYLVQKGLRQIRTSPRLSLETILEENKTPPDEVSEETVSYIIAPRLNAVGRLADANPMVEFLISNDPVFVATTYNQIEGLNSERKIKCDQVFKSAQSMLEQEPRLLDKPLIFLAHPDWPSGVVGIVASRLVELYHRPTILFNTADPALARGSARSVAGINITEAIRCHKDLLGSFGGHPMAAGLSVPTSNFDTLKYALYQTITAMAQESNFQPSIEIDMPVELKNLNLDLVNEFQQLAPFGPGNPSILFVANDLEIEGSSSLGRTREHEMLNVGDSDGNLYKVLWWQAAGLPHPNSRFDLAFSASMTKFKGKNELRLEWQDFRESNVGNPATSVKKARQMIETIDLRNAEDAAAELRRICTSPDTVVFSEGKIECPVAANDRLALTQAKQLVIWTIPPSMQILHSIIELVKPANMYLFGNNPVENTLPELLKRIGSLLKRTTTGDSGFPLLLDKLAAECCTTTQIIQLILHWYDARGDISLDENIDGGLVYRLSEHPKDEKAAARLQQQITKAHNEVVAFRNYYNTVDFISSMLPDETKKRRS